MVRKRKRKSKRKRTTRKVNPLDFNHTLTERRAKKNMRDYDRLMKIPFGIRRNKR